jgi:hypothetical protein
MRRLVRKPTKAPPSMPLPPTPAEAGTAPSCGLLAPAPVMAPAPRVPLATRRARSNTNFASIPEHHPATDVEDVEMRD